MKKLLLFFVFTLFQAAFSQKVDFIKIKRFKISTLSDSLRENSGLNFFHDKLFTFNDSGNPANIYEIDKTSGRIRQTFQTKLQNTDWEAITSDATNIYIGDFGNNAGTRKDLHLYKIGFKDSLNLNATKTIPFFYPEQTDFSSKNLDNDFDAEAMIFLNGKIHVFTKEWRSKATTHYVINPEISLKQPAEKSEAFKTGFVVTDASYFEKKLYLIGYTKKTEVFLSIFNETAPGIFFNEKPKKYYLGSTLSVGQIEGISVNKEGIYISGEEFKSPVGKAKQSFYFIPTKKLNR